MALQATKPDEDAPHACGAKASALPPGFCPARSFTPVASSGEQSKSFVRGLKMSCRIDRVVGGDDIVVLYISGRISIRDVDTLRNAIDDEASAVALDLKNVDLVDREAVKFLAQREINGTVLRNCPPYIREWVTRERAESMETSGDIGDT